jgi:hypothetical protein
MTNAQTLRHQLRTAGYCPIPLYGKEPPIYNAKKKNNRHRRGLGEWQLLTDVTAEQIDMWGKTWPDADNTGVLTFNMPVVDIDILHEEAAHAVEDHVRERFEERGYILVRIGKPPKRAIPFRAAMGPFKTFKISVIAPDGSEGEKIELLANGAQLVVAGVHPETGQAYRWFGGELDQIPREELPDIREDEAHALVNELVDILVRDFGYKRAPSRKANGAKPIPKDGGGGGDTKWAILTANILAGRELHDSIRDLGAMMIASGTSSGAAINQLRADGRVRSPQGCPLACAREQHPSGRRQRRRQVRQPHAFVFRASGRTRFCSRSTRNPTVDTALPTAARDAQRLPQMAGSGLRHRRP